ncbi:hypothetical protein ACFWFK_22590 [Micromonospora chalcea]
MRLPTEDEWERAADGIRRAGDGDRWTLRRNHEQQGRRDTPGTLSGRSPQGRPRSRSRRDRPPPAGHLRRPHPVRALVGEAVPQVGGTEVRTALASPGVRHGPSSGSGSCSRCAEGLPVCQCQGLQGRDHGPLGNDRRCARDGSCLVGRT